MSDIMARHPQDSAMSSIPLWLFLVACGSPSTPTVPTTTPETVLQAPPTPPPAVALPLTLAFAEGRVALHAAPDHSISIELVRDDTTLAFIGSAPQAQVRDLVLVLHECVTRINDGKIGPMGPGGIGWCRAKLDAEDEGRSIMLGNGGSNGQFLRFNFERDPELSATEPRPTWESQLQTEQWIQLSQAIKQLRAHVVKPAQHPTPE
jgi:hypothetical protein